MDNPLGPAAMLLVGYLRPIAGYLSRLGHLSTSCGGLNERSSRRADRELR